jgi:hypothetical protein
MEFISAVFAAFACCAELEALGFFIDLDLHHFAERTKLCILYSLTHKELVSKLFCLCSSFVPDLNVHLMC